MLEITSRKNFDIFKVILTLAKYNLQTSVSSRKILLEDAIIPADVLREICKIVPNYIVRNYSGDTQKEILEAHTDLKTVEKIEHTEIKYKSVQRGDVFFCNFGIPFKHEIAYERPAIILWNFVDKFLVLPCTTNLSSYDGKFKISFKKEDFIKPDKYVNLTESMGLINQLRVVDKSRLTSKVGTLTDEAFNEIILRIKTYFKFGKSDFSLNQLLILQEVNSDQLCEIINSSENNTVKINKILALYGFNLTSNGVSYLRDFILYSLELDTFNINALVEKVAKNNLRIPAQEIERLTNARFKELFGKKYKRIEFIHLIRTLLKEEKA